VDGAGFQPVLTDIADKRDSKESSENVNGFGLAVAGQFRTRDI
jgi:hypothetical protein